MEFKKIIILENDNEQDADNYAEHNIVAHSFPRVPVEIWYRFYFGFTKLDSYCNWARLEAADLPNTLFLTQTQLCGGPVSGYGDLIKMWLTIFKEIFDRGHRVNICVLTYPDFQWELIKWVQGGNGSNERKIRSALLRNVLDSHTLYTMSYCGYDFSKSIRIDKKWLRLNMFPQYAPFKLDGKNCELGYIRADHNGVGYTYSQETETGSWVSSTSDRVLPIEEVRQLLKKSKLSKNG
jgi:hypothetical protein